MLAVTTLSSAQPGADTRQVRALRWLLVASCLVAGVFAPVAPATASVVTGNDYSWPQCPRGVGNGQGQPLPHGTHSFAVVGLTNGRGLRENPCLASEWAYARSHTALVTGYTMVTYPTSSQRSAARVGHYGTCRTLACQLRNNGWAQAVFTATSLGKIGARPPLVWIDVETRDRQPWSHSRGNNSLVIKSVIAGLHAHGFAAGIYSNRYLWNTIAGFRTSLPEWVPAESLSRGCRLSFAGGRVLLSQWSHTHASGLTFDENGRCAGSPTMSSWWQSSHPVVTSIRRSSNGGLYARFGSRPAFNLYARDPHAAAVVAAPSIAGKVPLFVSVTPTGNVHARTLGTGWRNLGTARCRDLPAATIAGATLSLHCTDASRGAVVTTVPLSRYAATVGAGTTTPAPGAPAPARTTAVTLR
jgi:hypothetical protein